VCWERLETIYQGPWQLLAWQAVDAWPIVSTSSPSEVQATPQLQFQAASRPKHWGWEMVPPLWLLGCQLLFLHSLLLKP
jgi:hypothetical protein